MTRFGKATTLFFKINFWIFNLASALVLVTSPQYKFLLLLQPSRMLTNLFRRSHQFPKKQTSIQGQFSQKCTFFF